LKTYEGYEGILFNGQLKSNLLIEMTNIKVKNMTAKIVLYSFGTLNFGVVLGYFIINLKIILAKQ
jgi:hypothetical protein